MKGAFLQNSSIGKKTAGRVCRDIRRISAIITSSYVLAEKRLDIKSVSNYYIRYDIMGETGNSFNFK